MWDTILFSTYRWPTTLHLNVIITLNTFISKLSHKFKFSDKNMSVLSLGLYISVFKQFKNWAFRSCPQGTTKLCALWIWHLNCVYFFRYSFLPAIVLIIAEFQITSSLDVGAKCYRYYIMPFLHMRKERHKFS